MDMIEKQNMYILQTKWVCMEEYYSWEEVECAQPTQECVKIHDES